MNTTLRMGLTSFLLAASLTPALAQDAIEGRVSTTLKDQVLIKSGPVTYVVDGAADLQYLRAFDRSRRKVKVTGTPGKTIIDKDLGAVRPLSGVQVVDRVPAADRTGTISHRYDGAVILNTAKGPLELTRVPMELIAPLTGRRVQVSGLLFADGPLPQLALTGMKDQVIKAGYLTHRVIDPKSGEATYVGAGTIKPGTQVTVIGLEGWNTKEKTSAHAADMDADDMLFAYVQAGDKSGFIPAYKLELGSVVDRALRPFKRSTPQSRANAEKQIQQDEAVTAAKKARQQTVVLQSGKKKKGAIGSLDGSLDDQPMPNQLREQRQIPLDDMPQQKQLKLE